MTITESLRWAEAKLQTSPSSRLDAEVLLRFVCGLAPTQIITRSHEIITDKQWADFQALLGQRIEGIPIAYLTGEKEFWSMMFKVTPDTLIPRPETETLVEQALSIIPADEAWMIADLGTGSGAIAIAIASERPRCKVIATDSSEIALAVATNNAQRHRIKNISFECGDWTLALKNAYSKNKLFNIIVSNPPYIATNDPHLKTGDVLHEPLTALASGKDGLDDLAQIIADSKNCLLDGGYLLLEHGYDQAESVRQLLREHGYRNIALHKDLAGHVRVTGAQH